MKPPLCLLALAGFALALPPPGAAEPAAPPAAAGYVPCKFTKAARPAFPMRLLMEGVLRGETQLVIEVGPEGKIGDTLVTAYTRREFADETLRAIAESRLAPGTIDGQPVISILRLHVVFEINGVLVYQRFGPTEHRFEELDEKFEYRPHGLSTLDRQPAARHTPGPVYPHAWIEQGRTGTVIVDFYIDETGATRMPVALGQPDPLLAAVAVEAVKHWRFDPPLRRGRPALAHAQQRFVFKPEPPAA